MAHEPGFPYSLLRFIIIHWQFFPFFSSGRFLSSSKPLPSLLSKHHLASTHVHNGRTYVPLPLPQVRCGCVAFRGGGDREETNSHGGTRPKTNMLTPCSILPVNDFRTARVAEVLSDFQAIQYYIAASPVNPSNMDDYYTEGWTALRQCNLDGQRILNCGADTSVPETSGGPEEQAKAELKQSVRSTLPPPSPSSTSSSHASPGSPHGPRAAGDVSRWRMA